MQPLADQPFGRDRAGRAVHARVRDLAKPARNRQVGGLAIDDQTILCQPAGKRNPEAVPQIADEALDFALRLRPIRRTQPRPETAVPRKIEKSRMKAVTTAAIAVPLQDDGSHIVVEHLARHAAKGEERVLVRLDQRLDPLVVDKLDIGRPAPAQRRNKHR